MQLKILNGRINLPERLKNLNSTFVVKLYKNGSIVDYILSIPKNETRFRIPKNILQNLKIGKNDIVDLRIRKVKKLVSRPKKMFRANKINLLYFIPKSTIKGYQYIVIPKSKFLKIWYKTPVGRPHEIMIKRYVPLDFVRFLGYIQSEGGKLPKIIPKRRGFELNFTNKLINLHKDVVDLGEEAGISRNLWKVICTYNPKISKSFLQSKIKEFFRETGLEKNKLNLKISERVKKITFKIYINKTSLFEITYNTMNVIRKYLHASDNIKLKIEFLRGLFAGDGSIGIARDKSLHVAIMLFEGDKEFAEDYLKILKTLNLNCKLRKDNKKDMYVITINGNWNVLNFFYKNRIFYNVLHNRKKLLTAISLHDKYRVLSYLRSLKNKKTTYDLKKELNWNYGRLRKWLILRCKEGMIRKIGFKNYEGNIWVLTDKGLKTCKFINDINSQLLKH